MNKFPYYFLHYFLNFQSSKYSHYFLSLSLHNFLKNVPMKMMLNHLFHLFIGLSSSMFCFHQLMITLVLIILIFHHSKSSTEINPSTIFFFEGLWLIFFLIIISFHWILLHHSEIKVMFILILQLT